MFPPSTHILIIDDSMVSAMVTSRYLAELGYAKYMTALNGESALKKMSEAQAGGAPVGLIICDWMMPKMSGLALMKKIRENNEYCKTPFIFLTGMEEPEDVALAMNSGADAYIVKPVTIEILKKELERIYQKII